MNTSVANIYRSKHYNSSKHSRARTNFSYNQISETNLQAIRLIKSFMGLKGNWDSYGANCPSPIAIQKAVTFVVFLAEYNLDVFFTTPTPDGDILVEVKDGDARVEFELSADVPDHVSAWLGDDLQVEEDLNDTTQIAYIKWLICPDGNCPPNF